MKKLLLIISVVFLAHSALSAEIYTGHSVRGMSDLTKEEIIGFLHGGDTFKVGAGKFGTTHYGHGLIQTRSGPLFFGVGLGVVDKHPRLNGHFQFTLTTGLEFERFVVRWMHMSNGAGLFDRTDIQSNMANRGIDFLTVGVKF